MILKIYCDDRYLKYVNNVMPENTGKLHKKFTNYYFIALNNEDETKTTAR